MCHFAVTFYKSISGKLMLNTVFLMLCCLSLEGLNPVLQARVSSKIERGVLEGAFIALSRFSIGF